MRGRTWPFSLLAGVCIGAAALGTPALAATGPPRAELRANGGEATLQPFTEGWRSPRGDGCAAYDADGIPAYDLVLDVAHKNARPRIAIMRNREPRVRGFRAHAKLDESGQVRSDGRRVEFELDRKRRDGRKIWLLAFRVNVERRPYFQLFVTYRARGECRQGGYAAYGFGIGRE